MMNDWNDYSYCNYPIEVFPRPIRRVIRFVILFNLSVVCIGAFLFSIYGGIKVVREVIANPYAYATTTSHHQNHPHSAKGKRP